MLHCERWGVQCVSPTAAWHVSSTKESGATATPASWFWAVGVWCCTDIALQSLIVHQMQQTEFRREWTAPSMPFHLAGFRFQDSFISIPGGIQEYLIHLTWSHNIQNPYYLLFKKISISMSLLLRSRWNNRIIYLFYFNAVSHYCFIAFGRNRLD